MVRALGRARLCVHAWHSRRHDIPHFFPSCVVARHDVRELDSNTICFRRSTSAAVHDFNRTCKRSWASKKTPPSPAERQERVLTTWPDTSTARADESAERDSDGRGIGDGLCDGGSLRELLTRRERASADLVEVAREPEKRVLAAGSVPRTAHTGARRSQIIDGFATEDESGGDSGGMRRARGARRPRRATRAPHQTLTRPRTHASRVRNPRRRSRARRASCAASRAFPKTRRRTRARRTSPARSRRVRRSSPSARARSSAVDSEGFRSRRHPGIPCLRCGWPSPATSRSAAPSTRRASSTSTTTTTARHQRARCSCTCLPRRRRRRAASSRKRRG